MVRGLPDGGTEVVYVVTLHLRKIGGTARMFPTLGLLALNNLLELYRALASPVGAEAGAAEAQRSEGARKKKNLLAWIRRLMTLPEDALTPDLSEADVMGL